MKSPIMFLSSATTSLVIVIIGLHSVHGQYGMDSWYGMFGGYPRVPPYMAAAMAGYGSSFVPPTYGIALSMELVIQISLPKLPEGKGTFTDSKVTNITLESHGKSSGSKRPSHRNKRS